jgi:cytoskeletal protein CcmA (bactofilin family)
MTVIKHASVGSTMTQTEFEADELHTVDGSTSYTFLTSTGGTFTGDVTAGASLIASSSFSVAGQATLSGSLVASSSASIAGSLAVTGNITATASMIASSSMSVAGKATVSGSLVASSSASVAGALTVTGNVTATASLIGSSSASVAGGLTVSGSLVASSSASIAGGLTTVIKKFALNTSIADHDYSGETLSAVAYQAIAITDVCRLNSAGQWAIADASTESTAAGLPGMATAAASSGATLICLTDGLMRDDDGWGGAMTVGATYFLSETAGDVTATRPSTTGAIVRPVGYAQAARVFCFKPSPYFHEVTT